MKSKKQRKGTDSSEDEDDSEQSEELSNGNGPKIIPVAKLPEKLKTKKIIINISDTQYPVVEEIAEELGWIVQENEGAGDWDVWWTDREIAPDILFKMNLHQKINHYPGISQIARKNLLGLNLMAMKEKFQSEYSFFPDTWLIPIQFCKFRLYYQQKQKKRAQTYIVKPEALSQGKGIFLTKNIQQIMTGYRYVVQTYIKNPLLIEGLKFDLRIYVLLAGTEPLRLYIYEDGLARFATEKYEEPSGENLGNNYVHLTNYSLNKHNPQYVYNKDENETGVGHKRTLKTIYEQMQKLGYNVTELKRKINDIIVKTVISGLPTVSHQYRYCQPEEYENNMCFHILGFDIMVTDQIEPILIEVNHTPSFQTSTPLDYLVKKNLIKDTLNLMRITSQNKKLLFEKAKTTIKKRIQTGKREILKGKQRQAFIEKATKGRDVAEEGFLGGFTKIYPTDSEEVNEKYRQMIKRSQEVHKSTDQERIRLLKEEQENQKRKKKQENQQKDQQKKIQIENDKFVLSERKEQMLLQIEENPRTLSRKRRTKSRQNTKFRNKSFYFRNKVKQSLAPMNPLEQLMRFSEVMMKVVKKKQLHEKKMKDEEAYFEKVKDSILKKTQESNHSRAVKGSQKKGIFVKPKVYEIVEKKNYKTTQLQMIVSEKTEIFENKNGNWKGDRNMKNKFLRTKRLSLI